MKHNLLKASSVLISLIAIVCHISQCYLFNVYQTKTGIPNWLTAGHWQYLVWYISLSLSLVAGLVICFNIRCKQSTKFPSMDKYISFVSFLCIFISIIAVIVVGDSEPWTYGKVEGARFFGSCSRLFDASKDELSSILYNRCLLNNSTCALAILLCIIWIILTCANIYYVSSQRKNNSILASKNAIHPAVKEPVWGRYIPDPPSSIYSATIVDNRSGLLTPSSVLTRDKHTEFYSSVYKEKSSYSSRSSETDYYDDYSKYYNKPYSSKRSSVYYYGGDSYSVGKRSSNDDNDDKTRDAPLLRVSTQFLTQHSPPSLDSATTTGTPLYEKFSSKSVTTFDSPSSRYNKMFY